MVCAAATAISLNLAPLEAAALAVRTELDAAQIYIELAERMGPTHLRSKLKLLSDEERQHQRLLEEEFRDQFRGIRLMTPESALPREIDSPEKRSRLPLELLLARVVDLERRARDFYLDRAGQARDPVERRLYRFLADWELSHQVEVSAVLEMVVRYPQYFSETAEWEAA